MKPHTSLMYIIILFINFSLLEREMNIQRRVTWKKPNIKPFINFLVL